jgi:hypothetical protein
MGKHLTLDLNKIGCQAILMRRQSSTPGGRTGKPFASSRQDRQLTVLQLKTRVWGYF